MPIELPNLDDRTYDGLVEEARNAIPVDHPGWTDHNPSDPGIALIELFAWLTEMTLYRVNRIPERNYRTFLTLLDGRPRDTATMSLDEDIRATLQDLRERWRAVTADDYEYLVATQWPESPQAAARGADESVVRRVRCTAPMPGQISLIVVPQSGVGDAPWLAPRPALLEALAEFFDDRRLLTTRLSVTGPNYVRVALGATLYLKNDARASEVASAATQALQRYFHPWEGGDDGAGWPFGHAIHGSAVYAMLENLRGIDHVDGVVIQPADGRPVSSGTGDLTTIALQPHELVRVDGINLTLMERRGGQWALVSQ